MESRIYLKELKVKLRYERIVSVVGWCEKNHVTIHSDIGTNKRRFVFVEEFYRVYEKGLDKTIAQTYSAMNITSEYLRLHPPNKYVPKSEKEISFLSVLNNLKKQP